MSCYQDFLRKYFYFKEQSCSRKKFEKSIQISGEEMKLRVAFRTNGGFGNVLIHANFIKKFSEFIGKDNLKIIVYAHPIQEVTDAIFKEQEYVDSYYKHSDLRESDFYYFDLVVEIHSFPEVLKADMTKIHAISPTLYHLIEAWEAFRCNDNYKRFFTLRPVLNSLIYAFSILNKKNCLNVADITNAFNIKDFDIDVKISKLEDNVLSKYKLKKNGFITLQRGVNPFSKTAEAPKMWPKEYYEKLIPLLKHRYPGIKIIQLGESKERCKPISGVDLSLVGETDWDDLKILLKNALYHIDGECGLVHLRKALKAGPSVVMFGPTPKKFFGYIGNINISTNACNHWCAGLRTDWQKRCLLGKAKCMYSITPQLVIDKIKEYECHKLDSLLNDPEISLDHNWKDNWLKKVEVFAYEIVKVPLSDLKVRIIIEGKWEVLPLESSPALSFISGDKQKYIDYINYKNSLVPGDVHSVERFDKLIKSFNYDSGPLIVIDQDNVVLDGQHRACLCYKYNEAAIVKVLRISWCRA